MNKKMRFIFFVAAACFVFSLLYLPAAATSGERSITVNFTGWIAMEGGAKIKAWHNMVNGFEAKYPDVKIKYEGIGYEDTVKKLMVMAVAGNPPDVAQITSQWTWQFAAMGALEPLDDYISQDYLADCAWGKSALIDPGKCEGKLYSAVWVAAPTALGWNKPVFRIAGLDPEKGPKNWLEMEQMALKIGQSGLKEIYGFGQDTSLYTYAGLNTILWLWAYGGRFVDDQGNVVLNSPENAKALTRLQEISTIGNTITKGISIRETRDLFAHDRLGMYFDHTCMKGQWQNISGKGAAVDHNYGVTLMPASPVTGKPETFVQNHALCVFKQSKVKKVAADLVNFLVSDPETTAMYHRLFGQLPPGKSLLETSEYADPYSQNFANQLKTAKPLPVTHPMFLSAMVFLARAQQYTVLQGMDAQKALKSTEADIKIIYGQ